MMRVVGYRDLRPVNWFTGKREPLAAGEGHICDRCGAEHAIVFEVEDTETGKVYAVGSRCATQQFGFEPDKDEEAKRLIKSVKAQAAEALDNERQRLVSNLATQVAEDVFRLPVPEFTFDEIIEKSVGPRKRWRCGDGIAYSGLGRSDEETQIICLQGWARNRMRERIPAEWFKVSVLQSPERRSKVTTTMGAKTEALAYHAWQSLVAGR